MPTQTPTPSRHRPHHTRPRQARTPPLPEYEPPILPLHESSRTKFLSLVKSQTFRKVKTHLQHAEEKLTDSAGETNERLTDARVRLQRQRDKREEGEEDADRDEEEVERLNALEEQVVSVTERLEEQMRKTIDGDVRVDELGVVLGQFEREMEQLGTRRRGGDSDGDYEETSDGEVAPSRKLDDVLGEKYARWDGLSLTERYSSNNAYIGFYRVIHDAQYPGQDIPPVPHASTWFSHLEDPSKAPDSSARRTRHRKSPSPADSDEIAIERERVSLKCPLTLLYFVDPVTSTQCPHSFEREAIEEMIAHSPTTVPARQSAGVTSRSARRVRSVKCPVCSVVLTAADLQPDPALARRVRRFKPAEDGLSDGERRRPSGVRKSGITLASDEDEDEDEEMDEDQEMDVDSDNRQGGESPRGQDHVRIKQEMSTAPVDDD